MQYASPLARNMLAQKIVSPPEDWRASLPRYSKENLEKNQLVLDQVKDISDKYGCTSAQLSLAWLFHKGVEMGVAVIPIPGTTKIANAISNLGSVSIQISKDDCKLLESLADQVVGDRYSELGMSKTIESQQ
jgi:aryl-alcohol dehydrogenase-like predicted oxidoreductase